MEPAQGALNRVLRPLFPADSAAVFPFFGPGAVTARITARGRDGVSDTPDVCSERGRRVERHPAILYDTEMIDKNCPLIAMHIPKTGGMSMFASMCDYYGSSIADMYDMSAFDSDPAPAADALKNPDMAIYAGHFPFGLHKWLSRPSCYMAIVRKPLDRIVSLYHYTIQFREILRREAKTTGISISEFFESRRVADMYEEYIPWIEGEQTLRNFLDCHSPEIENGMVRRFSGVGLDPNPCTEETLALARENIEEYFSVVGVTERYGETMRLIRATFNWPWANEYHVNRGTHKKERKKQGYKLTNAMQRRIKEMNRMDMALYEWILKRFDKIAGTPNRPVIVPGGGRTDFDRVKLWRSIGSSPVRKAAMGHASGSRTGRPDARRLPAADTAGLAPARHRAW